MQVCKIWQQNKPFISFPRAKTFQEPISLHFMWNRNKTKPIVCDAWQVKIFLFPNKYQWIQVPTNDGLKLNIRNKNII